MWVVRIIADLDEITRGAVEIEKSRARPKIVLGDIFGVTLAHRVSICGKPYRFKKATVIVGIADDSRGKQLLKYERLQRLLRGCFKGNPSKSISKVTIVSTPTDDLVRRIGR